MTSCPTAASFSPRSRSPNVLPIGHLSNKSTVCSPTSMSHMSQELVRNHMKSHYQRITSAKACVDTSAPKSLKVTIKEKDRKKREALKRFTQTTPRPPSQNNHDNEGLDSLEDAMNANYYNDSILKDTFRGPSPRNGLSDLQPSRNKYREPSSPNIESRRNGLYKNNSKDYEITIDHNSYSQYERTTRSQQGLLTSSDNPHRTTSMKQSMEINNLDEREFDRQYYTSTPRLGDGEIAEEAPLHISRISFSYKEPPSTTTRKPKKPPKEIIWTEEQKYLNFISEVTNDVLARGIFSNRVLNRVFESHIEKRKGELDEEHMREMIDQLKEDLGITT